MNPYKILTIIFSIASLIAGFFILQFLMIKTNGNSEVKFESIDSARYLNYYLDKSKFQFTDSADSFVIQKNTIHAIFKKDEFVNKFLSSWTSYEGRLYPNNDCNFIRISIPYGQKDLTQGNIKFICLNSYITDNFNNLDIYNEL